MGLINIYKDGLGLKELQLYSERSANEFCFELESTFKTKGYRPKECNLKSSIIPNGYILINANYKYPVFFSLKSGSYFGNIFLNNKNIGTIMICDNDECYVDINLISGSRITVCGKTQEKSCNDAYVNNREYCILVKYNGERIIEIDNPKINRTRLSGLNKVGTANLNLLKNKEKDIILQTIPIFHFMVYRWYIAVDSSPGS